MKPKDVIESVFRCKDVGYVPSNIFVYDEIGKRLDAHYGNHDWSTRRIPYIYGWHAVGENSKDLDDGCVRSIYGYVTREPLSHLERPALEKPSLDGYKWPDPECLADWKQLASDYAANEGSFRLCGMCYGFTERASFIRGVENFLVDMIENPQFVHDMLDCYLELRLKLIDMIIDRIPVEGIFDGGDDCDQRGPMMGLRLWREFIGCRMKTVVDHVHAKGLPVVAHMCGNVRPLIPDMLAMKLDVLESLQPEAMDVYELKKETAGKMALIGGMGTQQMLPFGTPDEVRAETKRLVRELGKGGGYVLASAKAVMDDVPTENAAAFLDTAFACDRFFELGGELPKKK